MMMKVTVTVWNDEWLEDTDLASHWSPGVKIAVVSGRHGSPLL